MNRSLALVTLVASSLAGAGCQSYNFNPVSGCLIQPGGRQVTLTATGVADVLFVLDDSGSMIPKQQAIAQNFNAFIQQIATAQKARIALGLRPFDFHVAVTTSSVFRDYAVGNTGFSTRYENQLNSGCVTGVATAGGPYPQGNFTAVGTNPKVLNFSGSLNWASWGTATPDPAITALIRQFVGTNPAGGLYSDGNVAVGSCGSGEEQHLEAAHLAVAKALAGQQPGVSTSDFPHLGAKLVLVFVGDEDDCSGSAADPLLLTGLPGNDSCVADKFQTTQKLTPVADLAAYFTGLVTPSGQPPTTARPYQALGAAFIVSSNKCADGTYAAADACTPVIPRVNPAVCPVTPPPACAPPTAICSGAFGAGVRFLQFADEIRGAGHDVVIGSVCESFGTSLAAIGDLVQPPSLLSLPTTPAASEVTILRILNASGGKVKTCTQARNAGETSASGWWFVDCADRTTPPAVAPGATACVYINHLNGTCEANPGESYVAEYLGQVPIGGCASPTSDGTTDSADCAAKLGGTASQWSCYLAAGFTGNGTCICK